MNAPTLVIILLVSLTVRETMTAIAAEPSPIQGTGLAASVKQHRKSAGSNANAYYSVSIPLLCLD